MRSAGLVEAASASLKANFDLSKFKQSKGLNINSKFKEQEWIPFSDALQEALGLPGVPVGHITMARGGSNTGKTSLLIETAIQAQKKGILPVFIITEMKWDFAHAEQMGFQLTKKVDEKGEIEYDGFFLYADRSSLKSIEDVAEFITDILRDQEKGKLPYDLIFLWDSVGSIPCNMSIEQGKNNPMWNAGAMATQFGNFINQRFPLSRKQNFPYTNTLFVINKTGVQPAESPMSQPRMTNKGGNTMYWDSTLVITFGNITNSGTSKIKAVKNKKNVEFALRTKIAIDKIHIGGGVATKSTVIVTPHGFINDEDNAISAYKKKYSNDWFKDQSNDPIEIAEDMSEWEESNKISPILLEVEEE